MKKLIITSQFKKDLNQCNKRNYEINKLKNVLDILVSGETLPPNYKNHKLTPKSQDKWECHISPDWLLIYMISEDNIILVRTGTHSDLF